MVSRMFPRRIRFVESLQTNHEPSELEEIPRSWNRIERSWYKKNENVCFSFTYFITNLQSSLSIVLVDCMAQGRDNWGGSTASEHRWNAPILVTWKVICRACSWRQRCIKTFHVSSHCKLQESLATCMISRLAWLHTSYDLGVWASLQFLAMRLSLLGQDGAETGAAPIIAGLGLPLKR